MKMIIVVALALAAVAVAAPAEDTKSIGVVSQEYKRTDDGFMAILELNNGVKRIEEGKLKEANDEEGKPRTVLGISGSYTQIDEDGKPQTIEYVADENGYRAVGPAIPVAPARR